MPPKTQPANRPQIVRAKATIQQGHERTKIQVVLESSGDNILKRTGAFTVLRRPL